MEQDNQRDKIIEQLEALNVKLAKQISIKNILFTGVIYGIGFFIGSAIIATIILGMLGPMFGKIEWVKTNYETGTSILKGN